MSQTVLLRRLYFRVDSVSHHFGTARNSRFGHLARWDRVFIVVEHFLHLPDTGSVWSKLTEPDSLSSTIKRWAALTETITTLCPRTIIFELTHALQHRQILSYVAKDGLNGVQPALVVFMLFLFAHLAQSPLKRSQSLLLLLDPYLWLCRTDQLLEREVAKSWIECFNYRE